MATTDMGEVVVSKSRLESEPRTCCSGDTVATSNTSARRVEETGPTPARVLDQLAMDPGPAPAGFTVMTGEDMTIGLIKRGDFLGIDGRWCRVVLCTALNGWVSVETPAGYPCIKAAFLDVRVHLARVIDVEGVAV